MPDQRSEDLKITVYVVDDDPLARKLMVDEIASGPGTTVVGDGPVSGAVNGCVAAAGAQVIVLGAQRDGADWLTGRIVSLVANLNARVLVFAAGTAAQSAMSAVAAGAYGLIDKRAGTQQLRCAVEAVASGNVVMARDAAAQLAVLVPSGQGWPSAGRLATLTSSESHVLRLLSLGMSTEQAAARLGVRTGTVKSHVSHILAKLNVESRTQAVAMAHRLGFFPPATTINGDGD